MMAGLRSAYPNEDLTELIGSVKSSATRVCRRYSIPPQDAEDLMQQTLVALIDRRDQIKNPEAWLVGTLRNQCLMYWRRRRRRLYQAVDSSILEELASPAEPEQGNVDLEHDLARVLSRLPSRCRSVLELRYGLGCMPKETAQRLGYRSSSIYKILERCLAALTRTLTASGLVSADQAKTSTECQPKASR